MNTKLDLNKTMSILMLLVLAFGALRGMRAHAAPTSPETAPPERLRGEDWSQIQSIMRASLPAQQAYLKASNTETIDGFSYSVAISGDTVVVGAHGEDSSASGVDGDQNDNSAPESGAVYVFVRDGTSWSQQAYLKASNTGAADNFGCSVAISGDTLVVGASYEDSNASGVDGNQTDDSAENAGAAYVFTRSGATWSQQAYLKASNTDAGDYFGYSVAVSGDTLVVGAFGEASNASGVDGNQSDNSAYISGAAYVFTRSGTTWSQQAYLKASNTGEFDKFGGSVAISGETLVVGANGEASNATGVNGNQTDDSAENAGAAYVFVRSGMSWSQQAYLKASNTDGEDFFGETVAIYGDTVVVGAVGEDSWGRGVNGDESNNSATNSGAAYVFTRSGTSWSQQAYLKASNTGAWDRFGVSVAISGDRVVVGAYQEDSSATGVNGDQGNNLAVDSGAAYVFTRSGTSWSQPAYMQYLKASNTEANDMFGESLAVSEDTVVVGALWEDSNASGVDGNQTDNSASGSGAAYIFAFHPIMQTLFRSQGAYDGYIWESREDSNIGLRADSAGTSFNIGDDNQDRQYRAILSFNTAPLPDDAVITRVLLKIRKQGVVGEDHPTFQDTLLADIRKPFFGTSVTLVPGDFQAAANRSNVGTFHYTWVNNWYVAPINSLGYPYINLLGFTQFRLRFLIDDNDDMGADYMRFFSGNHTTLAVRPMLVIQYYVP